MWRFLLIFALLLLPPLPSTRGDEARRRDGTTVAGNLAFDGDSFRFGDEPVGRLEYVRRGKPAPPVRDCGWMLHLVGGDSFPVHPMELTEKELRVQTPWADELRLPRSAVEQIGQWPGRQVVAVSGETTSLKAGLPDVSKGWLVLRAPFVKTAARRLTLELGFVREGKPTPVNVDLSAPEVRIGVSAPEPAGIAGKLNRDDQSHRLGVAFDTDMLHITVDGYVLWSREHGPGILREARLISSGEGNETVRVEQMVIWRHEPPVKTPPSVRPSRDRLVTTENTEIYGVFPRFDSAGPVIDVREKVVSPPWAMVREQTFGDLGGDEKSTTGEHAELTLQTTDQPAARITGRVKGWNDRQVKLEHSRLGLLTIPMPLVTEIRPIFHGRRLVVAAGSHHLGVREVAGFRPLKPEGLAVRQVVELEDSLVDTDLVFAARTTHSPTALTITLNGEKLGSIRIHGDDPTTYRFRLPMTGRRGRNELEIRLDTEPRPGEVELRGLRLEIPLARSGEAAKNP
ncbi:hypothetical protein [Zavarzinella formosa]|uniref:hypothetical protein n=1 Tax=Zavarzinella formosa TaxID=360055 RepID=UPI000305F2CC|nr:hypothetical protein [Zavarzinella formosa]